VKGFRLLKGDELRQAAVAAGLIPASGIEAPSGDETRSGSAVGESPAPKGDAQ
jgi:hypothetical protein